MKPGDICPQTQNIIHDLFETLKAISPAFKQAWPSDKEYNMAKYQWILAFMQCGLKDGEKIKRGVDRFRLLGKAFVPTPGEFIALCRNDKDKYDRMYPLHHNLLTNEASTRNTAISHLSRIKDLLK